MTDPAFSPGSPVERPAGGGIAAAVGPELIGGLLAVVVVVALVGSRFATVGVTGSGVSPLPSLFPTNVPVRTAETIDRGAITTLRGVNGNLLAQGAAIQAALKSQPIDSSGIRAAFSNMNIQLGYGIAAANKLTETPAGAGVGNKLLAVYSDLGKTIDSTQNLILQSYPRWSAAANEALVSLQKLPGLGEELDALLVPSSEPPSGSPNGSLPPSPSVAPSTSVAPSPTAAPTPSPTVVPPTASPGVSPTATPPPATPSPSPGPNQIVNPGFELGVGPPWGLVLTGPAVATIAADTSSAHPPSKTSARIDISEPTTSPLFISLQQPGLQIEGGAQYTVSLYARAAAPRQLQVRVIGPSGSTIGTGSAAFPVTTEWTLMQFPLSAFIGSDQATLAIDVGGDTTTVWIDDVSVARIPPGAP